MLIKIFQALVGFLGASISSKKTARLALRGFLKQQGFAYRKIPSFVLDEIADDALRISEVVSSMDQSRPKAVWLTEYVETAADTIVGIALLEDSQSNDDFSSERLRASAVYKIFLKHGIVVL